MTKKDYIAIGEIIRRNVVRTPDGKPSLREGRVVMCFANFMNDLCDLFREDNPLFKESRFRSFVAGECGLNGGKIK